MAETMKCIIGAMLINYPIKDGNVLLADLSVTNNNKNQIDTCTPSTPTNIDQTNKFILDFILTHLITLDPFEIWKFKNALPLYTAVIEKEHEDNTLTKPKVETRIIRSTGVNTLYPLYIIGIYVDQKYMAQGVGETVEIAIDQAARQALKTKFGFIHPNMGAAFDFDHDRILPNLIDMTDPQTGAQLNDFFTPNVSIHALVNDATAVDFEISLDHNTEHTREPDESLNYITQTHDHVLYDKVLKNLQPTSLYEKI